MDEDDRGRNSGVSSMKICKKVLLKCVKADDGDDDDADDDGGPDVKMYFTPKFVDFAKDLEDDKDGMRLMNPAEYTSYVRINEDGKPEFCATGYQLDAKSNTDGVCLYHAMDTLQRLYSDAGFYDHISTDLNGDVLEKDD